MSGRRRIKKKNLSLLLATLILNIDFTDAKNGKWKPGNENLRRYDIDRTLQNVGNPIDGTLQNDGILHIDRNMQNDRNPIDSTLQNGRNRIDRTLQNHDRAPIGRNFFDRTSQNDRKMPIGRELQNAGNPIDGTLQNDGIPHINRNLQNGRNPIDRISQNGRNPVDRTMQNYGRAPIGRNFFDRTFQNDKRMPIGRALQIDRRTPIDKAWQNDRGMPIDRAWQNDRKAPIDTALENDGRGPIGRNFFDRTLHNEGGMPIGRALQIERKPPIGKAWQNDRRMPIDRALQNDRRMPIDRAWQNERKTLINRETQIDRRMPIHRARQNDRKTPIDRAQRIDKRTSIDGAVQIDKSVPIDRAWQNEKKAFINRAMPIYRRTPIDRAMQNSSSIPIDRIKLYNKKIRKVRKNQADDIVNKTIKREQIWEPQNDIQVQSIRRSMALNSQRKQNDRRMLVFTTPAPRIARMGDDATVNQGDKSTLGFAQRFFNFMHLSNLMLMFKNKPAGFDDFWDSMKHLFKKLSRLQPKGDTALTIKACYIIATTFMNARHDLRKYFNIRYFYANNLPYEVGYIVCEIVLKYHRMLELFALATKYFYEHQNTQFAAPPYVLHLYTALIEMTTVIGHLCYMLQELEDKYSYNKAIPKSGFLDYGVDPKIRARELKDLSKFKKFEENIHKYDDDLKKQQKKKEKQRKLQLKKFLANIEPGKYKATTPSRLQGTGHHFPAIYGWSIEYWW